MRLSVSSTLASGSIVSTPVVHTSLTVVDSASMAFGHAADDDVAVGDEALGHLPTVHQHRVADVAVAHDARRR